MPSIRNQELLQETKDRMQKSSALFFVDYQGLTHLQLEEAHNALRDMDAEMAVVKNTLANIALKEEKNVDAADRFDGPLAVLFAYNDAVQVAKFLKDFAKKYELPKVKFGLFEGNILEADSVNALASIPPREVLIAKLVGLMKAPINGLVFDLKYPITKLAFAMKEIEKKKTATS